MLQANKDTDEEVALEACEFWYASALQTFHIYSSRVDIV